MGIREEILVTNGPAGPCWIGLFDILGFKQLHEKMGHADVGVLVQTAMRNAELVIGEGLGFHIYADTILIFPNGTRNLSEDMVLRRLISAGRFLLASATLASLPMRGAITKGEFGMSPMWQDRNGQNLGINIWGKALVKAAELERSQMWAGGLVDAGAASTSDERGALYDRGRSEDLIEYPIPLHEDAIQREDLLALNWPTAIGTPPHLVRRRIATFAPEKRDATLAFFDHCVPDAQDK